MTREPAQAGNRASRTEHYLQWWENSPEWNTETSAADKRHNSSLLSECCGCGARWELCSRSGVLNVLLPNCCQPAVQNAQFLASGAPVTDGGDAASKGRANVRSVAPCCVDLHMFVSGCCTSLRAGTGFAARCGAMRVPNAGMRNRTRRACVRVGMRSNDALARTHSQQKARSHHRSSVDILRGRELNPGLPRDRRKY